MSNTSSTYSGWRDRLTYIVAEAQFLVGGLLVSLAIAFIWFRPTIPGVPPIVVGWSAAFMLLGPPLFGFFVWLVKKLRTRNMVSVHHVNAREDTIEKWHVEPEWWSEKEVEGPNPYPVNGGDGWAVQEFDYDEELEQLRVKGVWLEETQDTKLLTSKSHMESIYEKLTESHIALGILRDSVSEFGADIQKRITNRAAEARERGKMLDKSAVKDVFETFEEDAKMGPEDLPTLEQDETAEPDTGEIEAAPDLEGMADQTAEAVATDGGNDGRN